MISLKTKFEKHANDNEKRRRSIKQNEKVKLNQSIIIKKALSDANLNGNLCKKITFYDENDTNYKNINCTKINSNENEKSILFDSSESDKEDFEITEKNQFSGKKGFELLSLQSTYGNDERFKIDERFLEDEKEYLNQSEKKTSDNERNTAAEKVQQLKILENVLGTPLIEAEKEKKTKKRTYEMIRYDASNKDHEIYEVNTQTQIGNSLSSSKKNKEKIKIKKTDIDLSTPQVSKEKFYEVSNDIKNCFKDKNGNSQFSLLQSYGVNGFENSKEIEIKMNCEDENENAGDFKNDYLEEHNLQRDKDYKKINRMNEQVREPKKDDRSTIAKGIWKESFFFIQDDLRIKEAVEFINKKDSTEAIDAAENYGQLRKKLKEILRLHLKKQMHKKDPFKNKIGGMNKKQLATLKSKNSKMVFNKRKPFKV